jgi:aminocarboxymuconate-semialdehyde decarboxylase
VAFCHGGGSFAGTIGRIEHGFNMRPDLVAIDNPVNPRHYCGHFWVDTLTFDEHILNDIIRLFGSKRVALGTDYPFPLGELEPGKLINSMNFSRELQEDLFYKSALEWLGMKLENFK